MARDAQLVMTEVNYTVVDVSSDSTTVSTDRCIYYGAIVTTALSAHVLPIQDGSTVIDAFAASAAAGTRSLLPFGIACNSLVVDPNDSATGTVTILWRTISAS